MIERWLPVIDYEKGYEVSNLGRVRSLSRIVPYKESCRQLRGKVLAPVFDGRGYQTVRLYRDGVSKRVKVHQLVCRAFNGPPNALHRHVGHLDGDRSNPAADNLKWVSPIENAYHKRWHGRHQARAAHPRARLTEEDVRLIRLRTANSATLAAKFGVSRHTIFDIWQNRRWGDAHD